MTQHLLLPFVGALAWLLVVGPWWPALPRQALGQTPLRAVESGLLIHAPVEARDGTGYYALSPNIEPLPNSGPSSPWRPTQIADVPPDDADSLPFGAGLPDYLLPEPLVEDGLTGSIFGEVLRQEWAPPERSGLWNWLLGRRRGFAEAGLGTEFVAVAPMEIEISQPLNGLRMRIDSFKGFSPPDRAEYLWARPQSQGGRGPELPPVEVESVDYQDLRFLFEFGGEKFSVGTEVPIRIMDPVTNDNTAGMGDMSLATKLVLCDGVRWQFSQLFRTYFNTGAPSKGLGNGHISLEPGLLGRFRINDRTYLHGEIDYWFAIAGHPEHAGQVLRWGLGISHVWRDSDSLALIPTFEVLWLSALDGKQSVPFEPGQESRLADVDGHVGTWALPGLRTVIDTGGDLGILEFGLIGGLDLGSSGWHNNMLRFEVRRQF